MLKENKEVLDCFFEAVTGVVTDKDPKNTLDKDVSDFLMSDLESKLIEIL